MFGPDGQSVGCVSDGKVNFYNLNTGVLIQSFECTNESKGKPDDFQIDHTGKLLVVSYDWGVVAFNYETGERLYKLTDNTQGHKNEFRGLRFSTDNKWLVAQSAFYKTRGQLYDMEKKRWGRSFFDFNAQTQQAIVSGQNLPFAIWDLKTNKELFSFAFIGQEDWVVLHPSGLFDASPNLLNKLVFMQGPNSININVLKAKYLEPGLWSKVMAGLPLRKI
jgi:WD40 repeat protein